MPSNPQTATDSARAVDALLKSIRSKVRSNRAEVAKPEDPAEIARLLAHIRQQIDGSHVSAGTDGAEIGEPAIRDQAISRIESELNAALAAHRQVGQLNPRLPGIHNHTVQLVKKTMRRSLTWYTRPLQQFQGAVLHGLQQIVATLQSHSDALRTMDAKLDDSVASSERQMAELKRELEALRSELQCTQEELHRSSTKKRDGSDDQA